MKKRILIALVALTCLVSSAQVDLPIGMAPWELEGKKYYNNDLSPFSVTDPPVSPVRAMAQWEELQGIVITWSTGTSAKYRTILTDIAREASKECTVYVVCNDTTSKSTSTDAKYWLITNQKLTNIKFIKTNFDAIWVRDYGPKSVYTNDVDSLILIDWIYNRPRVNDDKVPSAVATKLNLPLYQNTVAPNDLVHTGGNFMTDGLGTAFSSKLVLDENSKTPGTSGAFNKSVKNEQQVKDIMKSYMGIDNYALMTVLPYDAIHHIDMHMKMIDEETILVGEYPSGKADGPQIEANIQYLLSNFNSVFGSPYKIIRIPQPDDWLNKYPDAAGYYVNYTNAVFVNKTVLIPKYGIPEDSTAKRIWKEALPGYNIVDLDGKTIVQAGGVIHCITHEIGANEPLLISHQALPKLTSITWPYKIDAKIIHKSGIKNASVYYRVNGGPWLSEAMTLTNQSTNTWTGYIPGQADGTKVDYYIQADAISGKSQVRPMPAPASFWSFNVNISTEVNVSSENGFNFEGVFPNPSNGITCIPLVSSKETEGKIALYDVLGNEVQLIHYGHIKSGEQKFFTNTMNLPSGAYLLKFETAEFIAVQKLMIR